MSAFGRGPQEIQLALAEKLERVDGIDARAKVAGSGVIGRVGRNRDVPMIDGRDLGMAAQGDGGFDSAGRSSASTAKKISDSKSFQSERVGCWCSVRPSRAAKSGRCFRAPLGQVH